MIKDKKGAAGQFRTGVHPVQRGRRLGEAGATPDHPCALPTLSGCSTAFNDEPNIMLSRFMSLDQTLYVLATSAAILNFSTVTPGGQESELANRNGPPWPSSITDST